MWGSCCMDITLKAQSYPGLSQKMQQHWCSLYCILWANQGLGKDVELSFKLFLLLPLTLPGLQWAKWDLHALSLAYFSLDLRRHVESMPRAPSVFSISSSLTHSQLVMAPALNVLFANLLASSRGSNCICAHAPGALESPANVPLQQLPCQWPTSSTDVVQDPSRIIP